MHRLQLKQLVTNAPVINGFSYPLLRLLVDRMRELRDSKKHLADARTLTNEAAALVSHIASQLKLTDPVDVQRHFNEWEIAEILQSAESFLSIFEPTENELATPTVTDL